MKKLEEVSVIHCQSLSICYNNELVHIHYSHNHIHISAIQIRGENTFLIQFYKFSWLPVVEVVKEILPTYRGDLGSSLQLKISGGEMPNQSKGILA